VPGTSRPTGVRTPQFIGNHWSRSSDHLTVRDLGVDAGGSNRMPVCQLDTGAAFKGQCATSEVVAPVMVIPVCAWLVPAAMAVLALMTVPLPTVRVTLRPLFSVIWPITVSVPGTKLAGGPVVQSWYRRCRNRSASRLLPLVHSGIQSHSGCTRYC
jgi:hypothetical protein